MRATSRQQPAGLRPAEAAFAAELHQVRPDLDAAFAAALPGARAAVLARLWRALRIEPLPLVPGLRARLSGPDRRPYDVDAPASGYAVRLDDEAFTHPATLLEALALPGSGTLLAEVEHSVASLALSRAGTGTGAGAAPSLDPLGSLEAAERSIVDGHPYHPCCRSRPGFTVADQLAFAPEHGADVALELVVLPPERTVAVGDWPGWLRDEHGAALLPVHPWQAREVLPGLGLTPTGRTLPAAPLMSVRTLAPLDGGPHLKTSLSLRMTSSVRDISGGSVRNAPAISALLEGLVARLDGSLRITRNLAAAAALVDGEPSPDLAVIVRESPTVGLRPGERVVPLATLAAHPLKTEDPAAWLAAFARLAWPPLLTLWNLGVALEAHGQNLLLVLDGADRPVRLVYRDLNDIRVAPRRLSRAGEEVPLTGHVVSDDPLVLRRKLLGSLLGGAFGGLVSGFGGGDRVLEDRLWQAVAVEARSLAPELLDDPADRRALLEQPVPVKALTLMRLDGGPTGDRWTETPNPLA
ncbi:IucA/IucC family siderophore biosynthesis protein [Streptacidiphilus pinicola]|uniref:IucA/IucC family siderophore biosynthesis protein n=1 Tax=Streptacidiphilus pinicola TaxID=2219663 RepID=A0A2X0IDH7_9ACTN|nr:IucA/IucC family siderophore biosynthesis protein [Streptacidiphilus pinicola]RAG82577.1 IucA/IucC family siderophore biosynthesis protein [Streptacidiphilus pinicola]